MSLSTTIKSIQDIMRKDVGVDGDAQRIGQLVWLLFLKIWDDREQELELMEDDFASPLINVTWVDETVTCRARIREETPEGGRTRVHCDVWVEKEAAEAANAELGTDRARLEAQMKTVIAPREAEPLMHAIETINGKRDELDDKELAALEEQAELDDELTAHLGNEESLRGALQSSDEALARVCDDIDAELVGLANQRVVALEPLASSVTSRYGERSSAGVEQANNALGLRFLEHRIHFVDVDSRLAKNIHFGVLRDQVWRCGNLYAMSRKKQADEILVGSIGNRSQIGQ